LLKIWAESKIKGQLILAGRIEPAIAEKFADFLNRSDVHALGHVSDIASVYRSADIFAFPSLEEGSPLAIYEAMGCSLPSVLSPIAAGEVARNGVETIVANPYESESWIDALRLLARDDGLRLQLGQSARKRAMEYTWQNVADRRRMMLQLETSPCAPAIA
jgi:glycosyltransferase involved in cell wall biosynthesis